MAMHTTPRDNVTELFPQTQASTEAQGLKLSVRCEFWNFEKSGKTSTAEIDFSQVTDKPLHSGTIGDIIEFLEDIQNRLDSETFDWVKRRHRDDETDPGA